VNMNSLDHESVELMPKCVGDSGAGVVYGAGMRLPKEIFVM